MKPMINELVDGQDVTSFFVASDVEKHSKKNGDPYFSMTLRDKTGSLKAKMWEPMLEEVKNDSLVKVAATVKTYKNKLELTIKQMRAVQLRDESETSVDDFLPVGPRDRFMQMRDLEAIIDGEWMKDAGLKAVCLHVINDPRLHMAFRDCPAAVTMHHAYVGGLLDHTLSMMIAVSKLSTHYADLDDSLLIAACLFHDIGKTRELNWDLAISYTTEGRLVGHIPIGLEILDQLRSCYWDAVLKAAKREAKTDGEDENAVKNASDKWNHLRHIVASHHGQIDWGALKVPMSREAVLFHLIDQMDAKMAGMDTIEKENVDDAGFTSWQRLIGASAWNPKERA